MHNFNIKAYVRSPITHSGFVSPPFGSFNVSSIDVVTNNIQFEGNDVIGYLQINFTNSVSVNSVVYFNIVPFSQTIRVGNKIIKHSVSNSWSDLTANNIKLGSLSLTQLLKVNPAYPDFEDIQTRKDWDIMFILYTIEP